MDDYPVLRVALEWWLRTSWAVLPQYKDSEPRPAVPDTLPAVNYLTLCLAGGERHGEEEGHNIRVRASPDYYSNPWHDAVQVAPP